MGTSNKASIELGARHAEAVHSAIQHWADAGTISQAQAATLSETITIQPFDWETFAKYTFRLSVISLTLAVTSIVFERRFVVIYRRIVALPAWSRAAVTAVMATGVHVFAYERSGRVQRQKYANEAIHGVGALFFALAALQLLEQLEQWFNQKHEDSDASSQPESEKSTDRDHRKRRRAVMKARVRFKENALRGVLLGLATIYATVGVLSASNFIWSCSMAVLAYCIFCLDMGGRINIIGNYRIKVDPPVVSMAFGLLFIANSLPMRFYAITAPLWSTTRNWGMLYCFIPLWLLSVLEYIGISVESKLSSRKGLLSQQARFLIWSFLLFVASTICIWHGLRYDDSTTEGFGLAFLGINLSTKFFECFWGWSKPLFFAGLAGALVMVGKYAEDMWNMRFLSA